MGGYRTLMNTIREEQSNGHEGGRKTMTFDEFRDLGYLQELNRNFLHPLGLAIQITRTEDGEQVISIWDAREDSEGIIFDYDSLTEQDRHDCEEKMFNVWANWDVRRAFRRQGLGFVIEPILGRRLHYDV